MANEMDVVGCIEGHFTQQKALPNHFRANTLAAAAKSCVDSHSFETKSNKGHA
jgi:hypothetical protein